MHPFFVICSVITIWTMAGGLMAMVFGSACAFAGGKNTMSEAEYYRDDSPLELNTNNERRDIRWAS